MSKYKAHFRNLFLCSLLVCCATVALAQQNLAYTGGSGDGYGMAELQVHPNPTGLVEALEKAIQLYPNPLRQGETLQLQLKPSAHIRQLTLRDASGKLLFEYRSIQHQHSGPLPLPTEGLPAGIYILQLWSAQASVSRKIVLL